jgi:hypothetical protein
MQPPQWVLTNRPAAVRKAPENFGRSQRGRGGRGPRRGWSGVGWGKGHAGTWKHKGARSTQRPALALAWGHTPRTDQQDDLHHEEHRGHHAGHLDIHREEAVGDEERHQHQQQEHDGLHSPQGQVHAGRAQRQQRVGQEVRRQPERDAEHTLQAEAVVDGLFGAALRAGAQRCHGPEIITGRRTIGRGGVVCLAQGPPTDAAACAQKRGARPNTVLNVAHARGGRAG